MKRIAIIVAAVLLGNVVSAQADQSIFHWYDTIRPHGHKRSDAIGEANVNTCNARVGIQYETVSPAFKGMHARARLPILVHDRQTDAEVEAEFSLRP